MTAATLEINVELASRVADYIEVNPYNYDQNSYGRTGPCGTRACIAGWTVHLALGAQFDPRRGEWLVGRKQIDAHTAAAQQLGLDGGTADLLFDGTGRPSEGVTVPDVLRRLAVEGPAVLRELWHIGWPDEDDAG